MGRKRALLSWSSGKDSAWTLHIARTMADVEIVGLLTTVNDEHRRVAMHGVRRELLQAQAEAADLPLWEVPLPYPCTNEEYEKRMTVVTQKARAAGVEQMIFGDLYLEGIRDYRVEKLAGTGIEPLFPLWGRDTRALAGEMIEAGLIAHLATVDPKQVPAHLAGRKYDASLLAALPATADPCGENGEFHTFVSDGPMFRSPVEIEIGERVEREGFVYCDLIPKDGSQPKDREHE